MIIRFFIYGSLGCLMEVFWTGLNSFRNKDYKLMSNTSIWMFFIYGMAVLLEPIIDLISNLPIIARGGIYVLCIYCVEYVTGSMLKKFDNCPWDYSGSRYSISGVIRLDYAPAWFAAGLLFERVYMLFSWL